MLFEEEVMLVVYVLWIMSMECISFVEVNNNYNQMQDRPLVNLLMLV